MEKTDQDEMLRQMMQTQEDEEAKEVQKENEAPVEEKESAEEAPVSEEPEAVEDAEKAEEQDAPVQAQETASTVVETASKQTEAPENGANNSQAEPAQASAPARRSRANYVEPSPRVKRKQFTEVAESVSEEIADKLLRYRRSASNGEPTVDDLLWAFAESLETVERNGRPVPMLKMRLHDFGVPVYVPQNIAGGNFARMNTFIGHSYTVAITSLVNLNEGDPHPNYLPLASIQQAEWAVKLPIYRAMENKETSKEAKNKARKGRVTNVIRVGLRSAVEMENPDYRPEYDARRWIVLYEYEGVQFSMPARQFKYLSSVKPIPEQIKIGETFDFRFISAARKEYRTDNRTVKEFIKTHDSDNAPKGDYIELNSTALDFRENPTEDLRNKLDSGTVFIAHVTAYSGVRGLIVEVAPGWQIKAFMDRRFEYVQLGDKDVAAHTPVAVRLNRLDFEHRIGQCSVISFPQGTRGSLMY